MALPLPQSANALQGVSDPTFALIEAHRAAENAHCAACSEYSRREQIAIDERKAHADLDLARRNEILGKSEDEAGRLGDVALDALDEFQVRQRRLSALALWYPT